MLEPLVGGTYLVPLNTHYNSGGIGIDLKWHIITNCNIFLCLSVWNMIFVENVTIEVIVP